MAVWLIFSNETLPFVPEDHARSSQLSQQIRVCAISVLESRLRIVRELRTYLALTPHTLSTPDLQESPLQHHTLWLNPARGTPPPEAARGDVREVCSLKFVFKQKYTPSDPRQLCSVAPHTVCLLSPPEFGDIFPHLILLSFRGGKSPSFLHCFSFLFVFCCHSHIFPETVWLELRARGLGILTPRLPGGMYLGTLLEYSEFQVFQLGVRIMIDSMTSQGDGEN